MCFNGRAAVSVAGVRPKSFELLSVFQHCVVRRRTTLQHAATRCNTLQHAATRCNTLQHAATRCNTPTSYDVKPRQRSIEPRSSPSKAVECVAACCSVCCRVYCRVMQRVAECCNNCARLAPVRTLIPYLVIAFTKIFVCLSSLFLLLFPIAVLHARGWEYGCVGVQVCGWLSLCRSRLTLTNLASYAIPRAP